MKTDYTSVSGSKSRWKNGIMCPFFMCRFQYIDIF